MNTRPPIIDPRTLTMLTLDTGPYLSCDECFETLDEAVEELVLGSGQLAERFRMHLLGCTACREEASVVAELVADEAGLDPDGQQARIEKVVAGLPGDG